MTTTQPEITTAESPAAYHPAMPLGRLTPHPHNPRHDLTDIDDLAASIAEVGIIEPLIAAPNPDDLTLTGEAESWWIIAGHRRHAAAQQAGLDTVPVIVRTDLTDPAEQLLWMLTENGQRDDLDPIDEAGAIQRLVTDHSLTQREIARRVGRSQPLVSKRLSLLKLPAVWHDAIRTGKVTLATAESATRLAGDEPRIAKATESIRNGYPDKTVANMVDSLVDAAAKEKRDNKTRAKMQAAGLIETDDPWGLGLDHAEHDKATHFRIGWHGEPEYYAPRPARDDTDDGETPTGRAARDDAEYEAERAARTERAEAVTAAVDHLSNQGAIKDDQTRLEFIARTVIGLALDRYGYDDTVSELAVLWRLNDDEDPIAELERWLDAHPDQWLNLAYQLALRDTAGFTRSYRTNGSAAWGKTTARFALAHLADHAGLVLTGDEQALIDGPFADTPDEPADDDQADDDQANDDDDEDVVAADLVAALAESLERAKVSLPPRSPAQPRSTTSEETADDEPAGKVSPPWAGFDGHTPKIIIGILNREHDKNPTAAWDLSHNATRYEQARERPRTDILEAVHFWRTQHTN